MIQYFLTSMYNLAVSMPVNTLIITLITIFLKIFAKVTIKESIKVIIGYLIICFVLSLFGLTMPSFTSIFEWIKEMTLNLWNSPIVQESQVVQ